MPRVSDEKTITEAQFQREVNNAIADTEAEVFEEAMGDNPLDNDGDRSLEEMGDGLEGDELDEDDVREDVDTEVDEDADEELEGDDDDERDRDEGRDDRRDARDRDDRDIRDRDDDRRTRDPRDRAQRDDDRVDARRRDHEERGDDDDRRANRRGREDDRDDRRAFVPAWRQRQEADRRRAAQGETEDLRARLAVAEARLNDMNARQNAAAGNGTARQDVEPDMFADPEGWKAWNRRQMADEAAKIADARIGAFRQESQQQMNDRVNANFHQAATRPGLAGLEFNAAYQTLIQLDPRDPQNRALVQSIFHANDPARALSDWFEDEGYAREFRADIARDLDGGGRIRTGRGRDRDRYRGDEEDDRRDTRRRDAHGREDRDYDRGRGRAPRQEFRRRFVPSLNGAPGGGGASGRAAQDPDMYDNSDAAVMRFAMR